MVKESITKGGRFKSITVGVELWSTTKTSSESNIIEIATAKNMFVEKVNIEDRFSCKIGSCFKLANGAGVGVCVAIVHSIGSTSAKCSFIFVRENAFLSFQRVYIENERDENLPCAKFEGSDFNVYPSAVFQWLKSCDPASVVFESRRFYDAVLTQISSQRRISPMSLGMGDFEGVDSIVKKEMTTLSSTTGVTPSMDVVLAALDEQGEKLMKMLTIQTKVQKMLSEGATGVTSKQATKDKVSDCFWSF